MDNEEGCGFAVGNQFRGGEWTLLIAVHDSNGRPSGCWEGGRATYAEYAYAEMSGECLYQKFINILHGYPENLIDSARCPYHFCPLCGAYMPDIFPCCQRQR